MSNRRNFLYHKNNLFSSQFKERLDRLKDRLEQSRLPALYDNLHAKYNVIEKNVEFIPDDLLSQINISYSQLFGTTNGLYNTIEKGESFDINLTKLIVNNLREASDDWWSLSIPYIHADISIVNKLKTDLELEKVQAEETNRQIEELKIKLENEFKDFRERYNEDYRDAELKKQTTHLADESKDNVHTSRLWLIFIGIASFFFAVIFYCIFKSFCFEKECFLNTELIEINKVCSTCGASVLYYEIVKAVLFRIVLLSGILYLIAFGIKNYNAAMHNYTVNAHRSNALDAAQRLIGRANTDEAKDEILKLAAQAIFAHQKSGHLSREAEPSNPNPIIEKIIDKTTGK